MLHAAPPVLQFSPDGKLLKSWGGPGAGYEWPESEHGIHVDKEGNVWLAGNGKDDHQILKFTPDGKFLQQIGKAGSTGGSNSTTQLGRPAHMVTDDAAGELYVADGYGNRRIIVFDAKTGAYKRHWGAYGTKEPHRRQAAALQAGGDHRLSKSFSNPVHCVRLSRDGLVYVCDRANNRIQVFNKDGTFVKEIQVEPQTLQNGSVWDLVLSEDKAQRYIFVADGANMADRHGRPPDRQEARQLRPPGPHGGRVQVGAQHGDRLQGQPLHRRSRHRPPRAEVQAHGWVIGASPPSQTPPVIPEAEPPARLSGSALRSAPPADTGRHPWRLITLCGRLAKSCGAGAMYREPVVSKSIAAIGYDDDAEMLEVEFVTSAVYR